MCERRAGGYSLETNFIFLVSRCGKGDSALVASANQYQYFVFTFAVSTWGYLVKLLARKRS